MRAATARQPFIFLAALRTIVNGSFFGVGHFVAVFSSLPTWAEWENPRIVRETKTIFDWWNWQRIRVKLELNGNGTIRTSSTGIENRNIIAFLFGYPFGNLCGIVEYIVFYIDRFEASILNCF